MKLKTLVLSCIIATMILAVGYEMNWARAAAPKAKNTSIGVISIRKVFQGSKKNEQFKSQLQAEQKKVLGDLDQLVKEIDNAKAGLNSFKLGSNEYMEQAKLILEKQHHHDAQKEFYQKQLALKTQQWGEKLYTDVVRITGEVAQLKGLDLVLAQEDSDLSLASADELGLAMRTRKVLYSGGCVDISDEVTVKLDAGK